MKKRVRSYTRWLCASLSALFAQQAPAQIMINSGLTLQPALELAKPVPPDLPFFPSLSVNPPTPIYGDPGHVRAWLADKGILPQIDYRSIANASISGGTRRASAVASQIGIELDVDWGRLAGIDGLSSYLVAAKRFGSNSSIDSGNALVRAESFLVTSTGGADIHFAYGYLQERFAHGRASIALGRFPVASFFGSSPLNCNFVANALCGNAKALTGRDVSFSVYPNSSWAGRFTVYPKRNLYVQAGAFAIDKAADTGPVFNRTGWDWSTNQIVGYSVPVEVGYIPMFGSRNLIGHYKAGLAVARAPYTPLDVSLPQNKGVTLQQKTKFWLMADQMFARYGGGVDQGLIGTVAYVHNQDRVSAYGDQIVTSIIDRGFWKRRPTDAIGFSISTLRVSRDLTRLQKRQFASGSKLTGGVSTPQRREINLEAFYDALIVRGVRIEPDLQFIVHPNAEAAVRNAVVIGVLIRVII